MSDVSLSAAVRQSLLSLQGTTDLIERTQNRLSTGLRVSSAVDDPVAFFSAKSLSDRASDLLEKKDGIDQGISTVTAALDGVEGIESLVKQMKGVVNSMKSATASQMDDLVTQFNDLRTQINNLATDSTYQGTNLINGVGQTLTVEFSEQSASLLSVASVDLRAGTAGLSIQSANNFTAGEFQASNGTIDQTSPTSSNFAGFISTTAASISVTFAGPTTTYSAGETVSFTYGTGSTFSLVAGTGSDLTVSNGGTVDIDVVTATDQIGTAAEFALVTTANRNLVLGYSADNTDKTAGETLKLTYNGTTTVTLSTADNGLVFDYGTATVTFNVSSGQTYVLTAGEVISATITTGASNTQDTAATFVNVGATITGATAASTGTVSVKYGVQIADRASSITANSLAARYVRAGDTTTLNAAISELDDALTTLRTNAQTLGSNVALLNTRLDFTSSYTNTLQEGADKLTLANINEEGANLLALQTRQQLGIQSLSLAAQAESSILQLFG